jgi:hypothetical protein
LRVQNVIRLSSHTTHRPPTSGLCDHHRGRCRDPAATSSTRTSFNTVLDSLALHDIDRLGLTRDDRWFLQTLCVDHMGGPVGPANLANSIGVDMPTVVGMIEPFLLRAGLIKRGPRGRMATTDAYKHLDLKPRSRWPGKTDLAVSGRSLVSRRARRRARASLAPHPPWWLHARTAASAHQHCAAPSY